MEMTKWNIRSTGNPSVAAELRRDLVPIEYGRTSTSIQHGMAEKRLTSSTIKPFFLWSTGTMAES